SAGAAVVNGKIYVLGGEVDPNPTGTPRNPISDSVEVYDPATNTWSPGPSLPEPLYEVTATVVVGTTIYVFGGANVSDNVSSAYALDTTNGTWSTLPSMPDARSDQVAGRCGNGL